MKSTPNRLLSLGAAMLLLVLCSGCVYVKQPVGDVTQVLVPEEWEGTWLDADGSIRFVQVANAATGELTVTNTEMSGGEIQLQKSSAWVRKSSKGDWQFVSWRPKAPEPGAREGYLWGRIEIGDDTALVWVPDTDRFEELVKDGRLKGTAANDNVELEPLSVADLEAIQSAKWGPLFNSVPSMVLRRVSRMLPPSNK